MTQESNSKEALEIEIMKLKAENQHLKQQGTSLSLKIATKGGISVYGLGRFPITLYKDQWNKLLEFAPTIAEFINDHADDLKSKP